MNIVNTAAANDIGFQSRQLSKFNSKSSVEIDIQDQNEFQRKLERARERFSRQNSDSFFEEINNLDNSNKKIEEEEQEEFMTLEISPMKEHNSVDEVPYVATQEAKHNTEFQQDAEGTLQVHSLRPSLEQSALPDDSQMMKKTVTVYKKSVVYQFHGKRKFYDKNSLFIFRGDCFLRKWVVWLVDWRIFEYFILLMILINSITLAIYDYSDRDSNSMYNQVLDKISMVLTIIFVIECALKIVAYGLIWHKNSYLRIGWNLIDFVVVVTGIDRRVSEVKIFESIESFKTVEEHKCCMKKLVKALISSIPDFVNVVAFLLFIYLLFAILGVYQYSGELYNRCRYNSVPDEQELIYGWKYDPSETRVCSQSGLGLFTCPADQYCGNPAQFGLSKDTDNITLDSKINYGIYNYDNVANSLQTVFQTITLYSWSTFMYNLMDADIPILAVLYCCSMVIIGAYFLMNLILAVIISSFIRIQHKELDDEIQKMEEIEKEEEEVQISKTFEENADFNHEPARPELETRERNNDSMRHGDPSQNILITASDNNQINVESLDSKDIPPRMNQTNNIEAVKSARDKPEMEQQPLQVVKSKTRESIDLSFLKPITTKKKIINIFNTAGRERRKKEQQAEADEAQQELRGEDNHNNNEEKKGDEEATPKPGLGNLFEQIAALRLKQGHLEVADNKDQNSSRVSSAFQNFMRKKQDDMMSKDKFFNQLLKETKENYKREKSTQGQTSLSQLTQLKLGLRLQRVNQDLSAQYRQFRIENRADKNKLYWIALNIVENRFFGLFINLSILANTAILATDKYPSNDDLQIIFDRVNIGFTVIFLIEMILKMLALDLKGYFYDAFNAFDCLIVLTSIIDLFVSNLLDSKKGGSLNALRTFRLLRIFKLAKSWQRFQDLLVTMGRTLKDVSVFSILLYLFVFTYTLLGLELFGYKMKFNDSGELDLTNGESPEANYDGFLMASTSVFIVLTNDPWSILYYNAYRAIGSVSTVFYISLVVIGQKIMLNLFLAILLQNFDEDSLNRVIQNRFKQKTGITENLSCVERSWNCFVASIQDFFNMNRNRDDTMLTNEAIQKKREVQAKTSSSTLKTSAILGKPRNLSNNGLLAASSNSLRNNTATSNQSPSSKPMTIPKELLENFQYLEGNSLFLFTQGNRVREFFYQVSIHAYFDYFIILTICVSGIGLAIDNPLNDPNGNLEYAVNLINEITTYIFIAEAVMKIFVFGFVLNGRSSYMRNIWNLIDFLIVIFSILSLTPLPSNLKYFKLLRVLRPIRIISRNKGMKVAVMALIQAIPNILNIMIISLLFYIIFGIIGISYFKGKFYYCYTDQIEDFSAEVIHKWDCLDQGGEWMLKDTSFDNIFQAAKTLFQMATTSGWTDIMFSAAAATDIDYEPIEGYNPYWQLFFILFMIVGSIFLLNLFVGVVISNFNREKEKIGMNNLLTDRQKEWLDMRLLVINSKPIKKLKPPNNPVRKWMFKLQEMKQFEMFILGCIILNTIVLCLRWYQQPSLVTQITEDINYCFTAIFALEAIIKIIALGRVYFHDGWNVFDLVIVVMSFASVFVSATTSLNLGGATTIVRTFRVARVFRLIKRAKSLKLVFNTFVMTLPALINVGSLLLLLLYLYACLGVQFFADVMDNGIMNDTLNFRNFGNAFLTLFVTATGDSWDQNMKAMLKQRDITYQCINGPSYQDYVNNGYKAVGCGLGTEGQLFFYSFFLLIPLTFLNLFIAIILQGYEDTQTKENRLFNMESLQQFRNVWADFDPEATTFIPISKLRPFLFALGFPLGFDKTYDGHKFKQDKFIISLELPTYNDLRDYQFLDVLDALSLRVVVRENYLKKRKEQDDKSFTEDNIEEHNSVLKRQMSEWMEKEVKQEIDQEINKLKFQDHALNIHAVQKINKNEEKLANKQKKVNMQKDDYFTSLHQAAAEAAFSHMRHIVQKRKAEREALKNKPMLNVSNLGDVEQSRIQGPPNSTVFQDYSQATIKSKLSRVLGQNSLKKNTSLSKNNSRNQSQSQDKKSKESFASSILDSPGMVDKIINEELRDQSALSKNKDSRVQQNSDFKIINEELEYQEKIEKLNLKDTRQVIMEEDERTEYARNGPAGSQFNVLDNIDLAFSRGQPRNQMRIELQDGSLGGTGGFNLMYSEDQTDLDPRSQLTSQLQDRLGFQKQQSRRATPADLQRRITKIIDTEVKKRLESKETREYLNQIVDEEERRIEAIINEEILDDSFLSDVHNKLEEQLAGIEVDNQNNDSVENLDAMDNADFDQIPAKKIQLFLSRKSSAVNA